MRAKEHLGFLVTITVREGLSRSEKEDLADRFVREALESSGLACNGELFGTGTELRLWVHRRGGASALESDRGIISSWIAANSGSITEGAVGELEIIEHWE